MEKVKELVQEAHFEFDGVSEYIWKSPNFIEHERELEKKKVKACFSEQPELAELRWALETRKLEGVYPTATSMSNLFYATSFFETYLLKLAIELEKIFEANINEQRGQGLSKILKFIKSCNIDYSSSEYWPAVDSMLKIRNCLTHANGNFNFIREKSRIEMQNIVKQNLYLNQLQKDALNSRMTSGVNNDVLIKDTELGKCLIINNMCSYIALHHYKDFFLDICTITLNKK